MLLEFLPLNCGQFTEQVSVNSVDSNRFLMFHPYRAILK